MTAGRKRDACGAGGGGAPCGGGARARPRASGGARARAPERLLRARWRTANVTVENRAVAASCTPCSVGAMLADLARDDAATLGARARALRRTSRSVAPSRV